MGDVGADELCPKELTARRAANGRRHIIHHGRGWRQLPSTHRFGLKSVAMDLPLAVTRKI